LIVVDSSVWIANLRGMDTIAVSKLNRLVETVDDQLLIGDLILLDVMQGARDHEHAARIERALRRFPIARMLDETIAIRAAAEYRQLRARGITVRKTVDMIIGTFCLAGGHALLHDDRDFDAMMRYSGLRVI
jgi:predicted nucleic acid-binding protein